MRTLRAFSAIALTAVVVSVTQAPLPARAAAENDAPALTTTAVLSIAGYDNLHGDLTYLFQSAGQPQLMQMIDGLIVQMTMGKGLVGLDTNRPLGVVFRSDGEQMAPLVFLPISDAPALLGLLKNVFPEQKMLEDDLYQLTGPVQVYLRLEGDYGFAALDRAHLENELPKPSEFISPLDNQYDLALSANLAELPEAYKQMLLMQVRASAEKKAERLPEEPEARYRGRQLGAKLTAEIAERVIEDGREAVVGFRISEEDKNLVIDLVLDAQPESQLALDLAPFSQVSSRFATLVDREALLSFAMTCDLSDTLHEVLQPMLVEAQGSALEKIEHSEKIKTAEGRVRAAALATRLFDVVLATVDARQLDSVINLRREADGTVTVVGTGHFAQPEQLNLAFEDFAELAAVNPDFEEVSLNVATHNGLAIHALEAKVADPEAKRILGDHPQLHVAFGNNAAFFALGQESLPALQTAIDSADAAADDKFRGMPLMIEMSLGPWIELAAANAEANPYFNLLRESFSTDDRFRLTLEGTPDGMRLRMQYEEGFLRFLGKAIATGFQQGLAGQ